MDGNQESQADEWGPFGRPLFNDPKFRYLTRVGVVDVGSNSVRLVVFDGAARSPHYFYNEKIMAGLGAGLSETGKLNPEGRVRALNALRRFQTLANIMDIGPLTAVATAAVREATDGPECCEEVLRETGLTLHVIDGTEEARLSAQGVLLGWPDASGIVCDIGGSSMELADVSEGEIGTCLTSRLGPLRLASFDDPNTRQKVIRKTLGKLTAKLNRQDRLYLVGGSWRAIARLDMERKDYPMHVMHEYRMTEDDIAATISWINETGIEELRQRTGLSEARITLVPIACEVLRELITALSPREIAVSSYGLREGLLYEQMPEELRHRDPLIEACRHAEAKDARRPGFGRKLYKFISPLFENIAVNRKRVVKAACLLHDVSWRAHPDYRHEVCFDNATRASLGGLTHRGRIILALALFHRYKNSREGSRFERYFELLAPGDTAGAEVLGKAMRFASMLTGDDANAMGTLEWDEQALFLRLTLPERSRPLFGEVASGRFAALAASLGAEHEVIFS